MTPDYRVHCQKVKSILRKAPLPGTFIPSKFYFSPYRACSHGCVYCDGRAEKYWIKGDFEKDIVVRSNAPEILEEELGKLRDRGIVCISSGVSDVYQPIEEKEMLTARCGEILARTKHPVMVLTKSDLILRDLALWEKVNRRSRFFLAITLTSLNEDIRKIFEPMAPSVDRRLEVIRKFKEKGCVVGVLANPFLPGITDSAADIEKLFKKLAELEVDFVIPGFLTLRPGKQKDFYLKKIENEELKNYYHSLYKEEKASGLPVTEYEQGLNRTLGHLLKKYSLNSQVPQNLYAPHYYSYDQVFILLSHMEILYQSRGINTTPLTKAIASYAKWLKEARKRHTRKVGGFRELDFFFKEQLAGGSFINILKNEKLFIFIRKVVLEEAVYNYKTMKLEEKQ